MDENTINIKLDVTLADVNVVLRALQELPYKDVATLFNKLHQQAGPQVQEATKAAAETEAANDAIEAVTGD